MIKWAVPAVLLIVLTSRIFYKHIQSVGNEKAWYVEQLHFQFSAQVDSVTIFPGANNGLVYFHVTGGRLEKSIEDQVNEKLKHNGDLRFILFRQNGKLAFHSGEIDKYYPRDSLSIDTNMNRIRIFRKKLFSSESKITKYLSGRPF